MINWKVRTRVVGVLVILYCLFLAAATGMGSASSSIVSAALNYALFIYFISGIGILMLKRWARYYAIAFLFILIGAGLYYCINNMTCPWIALFLPLFCTAYLLLPQVGTLFKK